MFELKIAAAPKSLDWMEWTIQLSAAYVQIMGILVWPLTIVIIVFSFRNSISTLITNIIKFSVAGAQFEFRQGLELAEQNQIVEETDGISEALPDASPVVDSVDKQVADKPSNKRYSIRIPSYWNELRLLDDPASIVQLSWQEVVRKLRLINEDFNNTRKIPEERRARNPSSRFIVTKLLRYNLIAETTAAMLLEMEKLRAISAHQGDRVVERDDAIRFLSLAKAAISELEKITMENVKPQRTTNSKKQASNVRK